jgi:iron complex outermembrane recepter protein
VVVGLGYDWFNVTDAERNVTDRDTGDLVSQVELEDPDTMDELNPMFGATYSLTDSTRIFGSIARKVRFPTLSQLYSSKSGNVNLDAETSINYTAGVSHVFGSLVYGEVAFFYYDISDFISRDAPGTEGIYRNYAEIDLSGIEVSSTFTPANDLIIRTGYTYMRARDRSEGRVTDNVTFVPEHKVDAGLSYVIPLIATPLDVTCVYVSDSFNQLPTPQRPQQESIKTGDYFIVNTRISKQFLKRFEAYLAVNNIFDSDYESEWGFPGPGRNFYVGLSARL